ncbi:hypothetical protein RHGRI_017730 [Rhododendron griersonianum]|uniref:Uncharacterized protein n=1 Tax=Rhododendron griersonianum TaxID=479676 RepID=A0AAV6JYX0_9ERIC|nr:hypothetical protein RHGRI_017730 [Rhododendron griersonianum]
MKRDPKRKLAKGKRTIEEQDGRVEGSTSKRHLRSEELKARLRKLEELAERKEYEELVKDITQSKGTDEPFSSYKDQLGFAISSALFDYGRELWCQISMLVCLATFLIVSNNESFDPYQEFEEQSIYLPYPFNIDADCQPANTRMNNSSRTKLRLSKKLRHLNPKPVHNLAFLYVQRRENGAHVH